MFKQNQIDEAYASTGLMKVPYGTMGPIWAPSTGLRKSHVGLIWAPSFGLYDVRFQVQIKRPGMTVDNIVFYGSALCIQEIFNKLHSVYDLVF